MTSLHETEVRARFDLLSGRFKRDVCARDVRLDAIRAAVEPRPGRRVLDLGCGKGRFARHLTEAGAKTIGIDLSAGMLAEACDIDRLRCSARRLPFADETFDAVIAIEVLEHIAAIDEVLSEARRVLRPGGVFAIVDKNAASFDGRRPWLPSLVLKWIDERRGRWMYPHRGPVRERWFWSWRFHARLRRWFDAVKVEYLLSPPEAAWWLFRRVPQCRLFVIWTATTEGRSS